MELPDVADTWKTFGSQQSVLRLKHADYHMTDAALVHPPLRFLCCEFVDRHAGSILCITCDR